MADEPKFHLIGETISVQEVGGDGRRVDRPDVAAFGLSQIVEATTKAGATNDMSHLRLIVDEIEDEMEENE